MQLRFASFAVTNLRWDFHPQEYARAGRTYKKTPCPEKQGVLVLVKMFRFFKKKNNDLQVALQTITPDK